MPVIISLKELWPDTDKGLMKKPLEKMCTDSVL